MYKTIIIYSVYCLNKLIFNEIPIQCYELATKEAIAFFFLIIIGLLGWILY